MKSEHKEDAMSDQLRAAREHMRGFKLAMWQNNLTKAAEILRSHAFFGNPLINVIVDGTPALVAAVQLNKPAFVNLLLTYGADRCARDAQGHTAYAYINAGNPECLRLLLVSAGAFPEGQAL